MQNDFSPQESLRLIETMITKVRSDISTNRFYFLFWGWFAFLAFLGQFFLKVVLQSPYHYMVWILTVPAVLLIVFRSNKFHQKGYNTYVGDSMKYLWTGIGISFFVLSFIISYSAGGWFIAYPFFILFYGLGTFVSGLLLKFKPLIIGGIFNWLLACCCPLLPYNYQMLTAAAAILTSYIIPGYLIAAKKTTI